MILLKSNNTCRNHPHMTQLLESEIYGKRRNMGISQYALAEVVGVTRNCIQQLECHEHLPRAETVFDMMHALGFDEDEIVTFLRKYLNAYYKDKALQREREKELAGIV